jgi:hypothetical protein
LPEKYQPEAGDGRNDQLFVPADSGSIRWGRLDCFCRGFMRFYPIHQVVRPLIKKPPVKSFEAGIIG